MEGLKGLIDTPSHSGEFQYWDSPPGRIPPGVGLEVVHRVVSPPERICLEHDLRKQGHIPLFREDSNYDYFFMGPKLSDFVLHAVVAVRLGGCFLLLDGST